MLLMPRKVNQSRAFQEQARMDGNVRPPLFYSECLDLGLDLGLESIIVNGASEFRSHVEEAHGKIHDLCLDTLPAGNRVGPAFFISKMQ